LISKVLSTTLHIQLGLSHPLALGLITLHSWSTFGIYRHPPSLLCPWMASHDAMQDAFVSITKDVGFSCFAWANPRSSITYSSIYTLTGWHCGFDGWHLNVGWHCYCWPHLSKFHFMANFILWGWYYNCNLN
jgi:hypothetical protein